MKEISSLNEDLTVQIQDLTVMVGTTMDRMKADIRNAKQRDDNHQKIRDLIVKSWFFTQTLKVAKSDTWRSVVPGVALGETLVFTQNSRPDGVKKQLRNVIFNGKVVKLTPDFCKWVFFLILL